MAHPLTISNFLRSKGEQRNGDFRSNYMYMHISKLARKIIPECLNTLCNEQFYMRKQYYLYTTEPLTIKEENCVLLLYKRINVEVWTESKPTWIFYCPLFHTVMPSVKSLNSCFFFFHSSSLLRCWQISLSDRPQLAVWSPLSSRPLHRRSWGHECSLRPSLGSAHSPHIPCI